MDEYTSTVNITVFPFSLKRLFPSTLMYHSLVMSFGLILIEECPIKEYSSVIISVAFSFLNCDVELFISPELHTSCENKLVLSFTNLYSI